MLTIWIIYWRTSIKIKQLKFGDLSNREINTIIKNNTITYRGCCFGRDGIGWN